eukprot:403366845
MNQQEQQFDRQPQQEKGRKHLILYILDIPYFLIVFLFYRVLAQSYFLPLFLVLNFVQKLVFMKVDKSSLYSQMIFAIPKLLFSIVQAIIYISYPLLPLLLLESFGAYDKLIGSSISTQLPIDDQTVGNSTQFIDPIMLSNISLSNSSLIINGSDTWNSTTWFALPTTLSLVESLQQLLPQLLSDYLSHLQNWDSQMKLVNYLAAYIMLDVLQFATLRRNSNRKRFGMALKPQEQQRKIGSLSYFGYHLLFDDFAEKVQQNPQDAIKCKIYFTHAFNCMIMGYVKLFLKLLEVVLYLIVQVFKAVMFIFPWRKSILDQKLQNAQNIYVGAGLIIIESLQTLLDIPFFILVIPISLLTPYRIKYLWRDFKEIPADKWRWKLLRYMGSVVTDIPYILMLICIILSVFMFLRMKQQIKVKMYNDNLELGDILKHEIWYNFKKLVKFSLKMIGLTVIFTIYLKSILLVPWRYQKHYNDILVLYLDIKKDFIVIINVFPWRKQMVNQMVKDLKDKNKQKNQGKNLDSDPQNENPEPQLNNQNMEDDNNQEQRPQENQVQQQVQENLYLELQIYIKQALETLLDIPFLLFIIPISVFTPYKISYLWGDLKTKKPDQWRGMLFDFLKACITDIPYIMMLISLSIFSFGFWTFRLYSSIQRKLKNDQNLRAGDILKKEIKYFFFKMLKTNIQILVGSTLLAIYILLSLLVPWRFAENFINLCQIYTLIRRKFDERMALKTLNEKIAKNLKYLWRDPIILICTLIYLITVTSSIWRIRRHISVSKSMIDQYFLKEKNVGLDLDKYGQWELDDIISTLIYHTHQNFKNLILDIVLVLTLILNILPFWRYNLLYQRYKLEKLERDDLIINPFQAVRDLPVVGLVVLMCFIMPWRVFTTLRYLCQIHEHFPGYEIKKIESKYVTLTFNLGIQDYQNIITLSTIFSPSNREYTKTLFFGKTLSYNDIQKLQEEEQLRRAMQRIVQKLHKEKNKHYYYLFPLSVLTFYHIGLFLYIYKNLETLVRPKPLDLDKLKKIFDYQQYQALTVMYPELQEKVWDSMYPHDVRYAIKVSNKEFVKTVMYLPLTLLTLIFNPYRTYQFFLGNKLHKFFEYEETENIRVIQQIEEYKRGNIVRYFIESLTDFLSFIAGTVIMLTGFRSIYMIAILSVNGHLSVFNRLLRRITKSSLLIIKMQQVESREREKQKQIELNEESIIDQIKKQDNYLSIKECIWLSLIEWVLDLLLLPFLLAYFILIPWRLSDLFEMAVSQFERVPTQKVKKSHYMREVNKGQLPKRLQAAIYLFKYILIDYLTFVLSLILVVTVWRAQNTLELVYSNFLLRFTRDKNTKAYLKTMIKDKTLIQQIVKEFKSLALDSVFLVLIILNVLMISRVKVLYQRLHGVYIKKKNRQEVQALNLINKVKSLKQALLNKKEQQEDENLEKDKQVKKKVQISDLSKNVMSVLLPNLEHNEILRLEQCSRKMLINGHHWPVWKNIYQEQHLKNPKIPKEYSYMNMIEQQNNDYRATCARSFLYLKQNVEAEIPEELLDYTKGSRVIIVEELIHSIQELPYVYNYPLDFIDKLLHSVTSEFQEFYDAKIQNYINMPRKSFLSFVLLGISIDENMDNYQRILETAWLYNHVRIITNLLKIQIMTSNIVKYMNLWIMLKIMKALSAGNYGNIWLKTSPINPLEFKIQAAVPRYALQFIMIVPLLIYIHFPFIIILVLCYMKFFSSLIDIPLISSGFVFVATILICIDYGLAYRKLGEDYRLRRVFPFIRPLCILTLAKQFLTYLYLLITGKLKSGGEWTVKKFKIMWVKFTDNSKVFGIALWKKIKQFGEWVIEPLKRAGRGAIYYLKVCYDIVSKGIKIIYDKISYVTTQLAYLLYTVMKSSLQSTWKFAIFFYQYLLVLPLKLTNSAYFSTFEFLLKFLKKFGIVGEVIFTLYGLVWLLWPLAIGFVYFGEVQYYIPATILTMLLIFRGRQIIVQNS